MANLLLPSASATSASTSARSLKGTRPSGQSVVLMALPGHKDNVTGDRTGEGRSDGATTESRRTDDVEV